MSIKLKRDPAPCEDSLRLGYVMTFNTKTGECVHREVTEVEVSNTPDPSKWLYTAIAGRRRAAPQR